MKHPSVLPGIAVVSLLASLACGPVATVVVTATPETMAMATVIPTAPTWTPEAMTPGVTPTLLVETSPPEPTTAVGCTPGAQWVADVTVPDSTIFAPNVPFVKTWRVRNSGTCAWEAGTQLVFASGDQMSGPSSVSVPAVAPGATTDISVNLTAPAIPGSYQGNWQLQAPDGTRFGAIIWVKIVVPPSETATATRTPTPTPHTPPPGLAILSFTAEVIQDLPPAGKRIRFHWRTTGATSAGIWSGTQVRFPLYWEATPPEEGTLTVDMATTYYRDPDMRLVIRDRAGQEAQASIKVPWPCRYSWFFSTDNPTCPAYEASTTWAAEEPFEHGRMLWLQEARTESTVYQKIILVFYDDGRFEKYDDTFLEGVDPESDPSIVPPVGLYQPVRGFGKLWRTNQTVRNRLGWATAPEQGFNTQWQMQMSESIGIPFFVRRLDGRIVRAAGWDLGSGGWQGVP